MIILLILLMIIYIYTYIRVDNNLFNLENVKYVVNSNFILLLSANSKLLV
jgi:hypothetical protein